MAGRQHPGRRAQPPAAAEPLQPLPVIVVVIDELAGRPEVRTVAIDGPQLTVGVGALVSDVPPLVRWLADTGTAILAARPVEPSLETVYFDAMGVRTTTNRPRQ